MNRLTVPIAAHVFFVRSACILLLQRQNTGFEDGNYGLPAGHLEPGESVTQAAVRECREEIGIDLDLTDLRAVGVTHYTSSSGTGSTSFLLQPSGAGNQLHARNAAPSPGIRYRPGRLILQPPPDKQVRHLTSPTARATIQV